VFVEPHLNTEAVHATVATWPGVTPNQTRAYILYMPYFLCTYVDFITAKFQALDVYYNNFVSF
jgi:hypothetical protein